MLIIEATTGSAPLKNVFKNFAKFTGKHMCRSLYFDKVDKKDTPTQVFYCEFCETFNKISFTEHLRVTDSIFAFHLFVSIILYSRKYVSSGFPWYVLSQNRNFYIYKNLFQKQSFRGVLIKRYTENTHHAKVRFK